MSAITQSAAIRLPFAARPLGRAVELITHNRVQLALPLLVAVVWQTSTALGWVQPYFLPSPASVAHTLYRMTVSEQLWYDFLVSATTVIEGFCVGTGVGLLLGIIAGLWHNFERFIGPSLHAVRQVPPLAWVPLLILWLGVGDMGKAILVGKAVFFPVFLNTLQGVRGVSSDYIEVGRVHGFSGFRLVRKVVLPAALPSIFTGVRYGAGLAWSVMIAAEMLGSRFGLGFLLVRAQELLQTSELFAVIIIIIGTVGFLLDLGFKRFEARCLRWKKGYQGQ